MSWKVKARQSDGSVSTILADDPKQALDLLKDFRARGLEAWAEDTEGRRVDETSLKLGS